MAVPKFDARIRQVAVLLTSVDTTTARQLLSQLPTAQAKQVRQAMVQLGNVSPEERKQALASFQQRSQQNTTPAVDESVAIEVASRQSVQGMDSLELSDASKNAAATYSVAQHAPLSVDEHAGQPHDQPPLAYWQDLDASDLAVILAGERPTVLAVVLNQIPIELATALLQSLPRETALEAVTKLPQLQSTPPDLLKEIHLHLQERIANFQIPKRLASQNVDRLRAILEAAQSSLRQDCVDRIVKQFPSLADRLGVDRLVVDRMGIDRMGVDQSMEATEQSGPSKPMRGRDAVFPPSVNRMTSSQESWQVAEPSDYARTSGATPAGSPAEDEAFSLSGETDATALRFPTGEPSNSISPPLIQMTFEELGTLPLADLAIVLKASEPALILLALSGASESMYRRVQSMLTPKDARRLDEKLTRLGPIQLRDIEKAQQHLSRIATEMLASGRIGSLSSMTITAAA